MTKEPEDYNIEHLYQSGRHMALSGVRFEHNPFNTGTDLSGLWEAGYQTGYRQLHSWKPDCTPAAPKPYTFLGYTRRARNAPSLPDGFEWKPAHAPYTDRATGLNYVQESNTGRMVMLMWVDDRGVCWVTDYRVLPVREVPYSNQSEAVAHVERELHNQRVRR